MPASQVRNIAVGQQPAPGWQATQHQKCRCSTCRTSVGKHNGNLVLCFVYIFLALPRFCHLSGETLQTMLLFRWIVFFISLLKFEVSSCGTRFSFLLHDQPILPVHTVLLCNRWCWLLAAIHSTLPGNDCRPLFYDFNEFSMLWRSLWSPITPSCDSFNLEVVYDQMTNVCHRLAFEQIVKLFCCSKFRIAVWSSDENVTYGGYWAAKSADASSLIEKM